MPSDARLTRLYNKLNREVFDSELPHSRSRDFRLVTTKKMTRTLGNCRFDPRANKPTHRIAINYSIFKWSSNGTPGIELVRTLLHEMCHLLMNVRDNGSVAGHGPRWQKAWANAARKYDDLYNPRESMYEHATDQNKYRYSGYRDRGNSPRHVAAAMGINDGYKWELTCPVCGYVHKANRLGRILKLACSFDGRVRHGSGCKAKLTAIRYR